MINSTQRWIGLFAVAMAAAVGSVRAQGIAGAADQAQGRLDAANSADVSAPVLTDTIRKGLAAEIDRQVQAATATQEKPGTPTNNWLAQQKSGTFRAIVLKSRTAAMGDVLRQGMAREAARQVQAATQAAAPAPAKKPMTWGKKVGIVAAIVGAGIGGWYLWAVQQPD